MPGLTKKELQDLWECSHRTVIRRLQRFKAKPCGWAGNSPVYATATCQAIARKVEKEKLSLLGGNGNGHKP